jgi:hypothetical protein
MVPRDPQLIRDRGHQTIRAALVAFEKVFGLGQWRSDAATDDDAAREAK